MLIGLISDTHIPDHIDKLPTQLKEVFRGVELILHAGDIYIPSVLDELEQIAPVLAAEGDDDPYLTRMDRRVQWNQNLVIEGVNIRVLHDMLMPKDPSAGYSKKETPPPPFQNHPDVIVSGHTHAPSLEKKDHVLLISPGSATFPRYRVELGTVGLLKVSSGKAEAEIIQLK